MRAAPVKTRTSQLVAQEMRAWMARRRLYGKDIAVVLGPSDFRTLFRSDYDLAM